MYHLMIVDDEPIICNGLRASIPWQSLGFQVAATAGSGVEALALLRSHPVDAILLDIQMPEMNGLEMIRVIRKTDPNLKVIIISGYSNFEYARESIKLRVEDYLLKPIDPKQVAAVFTALRARLDEERRPLEPAAPAYERIDPQKYAQSLIACIERGEPEQAKEEGESFLRRLRPLPAEDAASCCREVLERLESCFGIVRAQLETLENTPPEEAAAVFPGLLKAAVEAIGDSAGQMSVVLYKRARTIIDERYTEKDFSLGLLAQELNVSYSYLSALFSRQHKSGIKTYLVQKRMELARKLILERDLKMYEVADAVGYTNSRYFSDAFRRYFGMSPSQYLRRLGRNPED
jgi:two-component system response regulator YesN